MIIQETQIDRALLVIREYLSYDRESGVFTCLRHYSNKIRVGDSVGSGNAHGYIEFRFKGARFYAHRLAWWWIHGIFPPEIDHKNGITGDNRISNLRVAGRSTNLANTGRRKHTGFKGVYQDRRTGRWQAKIKYNYRPIHLGVYDTEEKAARAYDFVAIEHFGEFANLNFPAQRTA